MSQKEYLLGVVHRAKAIIESAPAEERIERLIDAGFALGCLVKQGFLDWDMAMMHCTDIARSAGLPPDSVQTEIALALSDGVKYEANEESADSNQPK